MTSNNNNADKNNKENQKEKEVNKTKEIIKRRPDTTTDIFARCDRCLSWHPLEPADKQGDRNYPLRIDPLAIVNDLEMKWICNRCWLECHYDREIRRKIEGDRIIEYLVEPANETPTSGINSANQSQEDKDKEPEPEYQKTDSRSTQGYVFYS